MLDSFLCRTKLKSILPLLPLGISSHVRPSKLSLIITEINNCKSVLQLPNCIFTVSNFFFFIIYWKKYLRICFYSAQLKYLLSTPSLKKKTLINLKIRRKPIFHFMWDTPVFTGAYYCRLLYRYFYVITVFRECKVDDFK